MGITSMRTSTTCIRWEVCSMSLTTSLDISEGEIFAEIFTYQASGLLYSIGRTLKQNNRASMPAIHLACIGEMEDASVEILTRSSRNAWKVAVGSVTVGLKG